MKLLEFIVASSLLTLMPGPDILFVMAQSIVQGRKTGIAVALGLCSGLFVALVADWVSARFGARQIPPATLAWIRAGVYWTIAVLFLFY